MTVGVGIDALERNPMYEETRELGRIDFISSMGGWMLR